MMRSDSKHYLNRCVVKSREPERKRWYWARLCHVPMPHLNNAGVALKGTRTNYFVIQYSPVLDICGPAYRYAEPAAKILNNARTQ